MDLKETIEERWSPRSFKDQQISKSTLEEILKDAGKAPSSFNDQPWRLIVGMKGDSTYEKVASGLNEFNAKWAAKAPVLLLTFAKKTFKKNGNPNRHAWHDLGAFVAFLSLRALEEGIYVHQMAGILPDEVHGRFDIPEDFELVTAVAMGYLGEAADLPEDLAASESPGSPRMELQEYVYADQWGSPF